MEIKNAKIIKTFLGIEDHGLLIFTLTLDYGGVVQGYQVILDDHDKEKEKRVGTAFGLEAIMRILQTVGAGSWEELPGKVVRVRTDKGLICAIAHFLKGNWLDLKDLAEQFRDEEKE